MGVLGRCSAFAALALAACSEVAPAGAWSSYRHDEVIAAQSDQGPWGGWRWIEWVARPGARFEEGGLLRAAQQRGWKLVRQRELAASDMSSWFTREGAPIFGPELLRFAHRAPLRRHVEPPCVLYEFDSRWLKAPEPDAELVPAPGYVLLSRDGARMALAHEWGE
jgi:hypothetical protein